MKKNGFTLVELLAVLIILAVISVFSIPYLLNSLYRARQLLSDENKAELIDAAKSYLTDYDLCNKKYVYKGTEKITINNHEYNSGDEMKCYDFKLYASDIKIPVTELIEEGFYNDGCDYDDEKALKSCKVDKECILTGAIKTETAHNGMYYVTSGYEVTLGDKCVKID